MFKKIGQIIFCCVLFVACSKQNEAPDIKQNSDEETTIPVFSFAKYTIQQGQHYCDGNTYPYYNDSALYFTVKFDSSAVYTTSLPANQGDINKLFGFADNNSHHQQYSARFGWRWYNNQLQLHAYIYNDGIRSSYNLGAVTIGEEHQCAILVKGSHYDFMLDGITISVPRTSKTAMAQGYKLYPYFGGDEAATHTVNIWIKEK